MHACTVVARNYLAQARVLAASVKQAHPHGRMTVLVLDGETHQGEHAAPDDFETVGPSDLPLTEREFHNMAAIYSVTEMATAIKPWLLRHVLGQGARSVLYLDPDIEVLAPLDHVVALTEVHGIALTPHTMRPVPRDGLSPDESDISIAGTHNLGFIGLSDAAAAFLDWWEARLARDCLIAVEKGIFVDQRWVDLAVHCFPHGIVADEGCNVAYWNLDHRHVTRTQGGYEVNGVPLRFFHFSGYDPDIPDVVCKYHAERPRVTFASQPALRRLFDDYARKLRTAGYDELRTSVYGYARAADGTLLSPALRRRYRQDLLDLAPGATPPPDPFDPAHIASFQEWARGALRKEALSTLRSGVGRKARNVVTLTGAALALRPQPARNRRRGRPQP